jgi:hypothetical protein
MGEQLIGFETAKLAKEKGFDEICYVSLWWDIKNERSQIYPHWHSNMGAPRNSIISNSKKGLISAPTQSLLQKWLRDIHNIHTSIDNNNSEEKGKWCFDLHKLPAGVIYLWKRGDPVYNTYEDALEEGLFQALKLIKQLWINER